MNDLPIVSIIVPTRDSSQFLEACLVSIKEQTYPNIELIVVDNNSTDATKEIAQKYTDKVFNQGPERSAQRNFGAKESSGEYLVFIDSDMTVSPEVVSEAVQVITANLNLVGVVIPEESFGEGFWAKCKKLERSFYVGVSWIEAARFFKKSVFTAIGGYNSDMVSGEDWDISQRIESQGKLGRVGSYIFHNEGTINLWKTLQKKYYYAQKFSQYTSANVGNVNTSKQTGLVSRYMLFFKQPKKLFQDPILGLGMLFMKTCEFGFGGVGYVTEKIRPVSFSNYSSVVPNELPMVSIIIPTFNAEKYFELCLASIAKQNYPKGKIEILVTDGGSTDDTIRIAGKYGAKILKNEKKIAEYGKNLGIQESKGKYFLLIDSDNELVEDNWLQNMVMAMEESPELFGVESPLSHDKKLSSLNRYFARMRIADPLAKLLASKPISSVVKKYSTILNFKKNDVLITGANGFIWNKDLVLVHRTWDEKFEEANYGTYIHATTGANYGIANNCSVRHYYCEGLGDYVKKRKKIALKMKQRLVKRQSNVWVTKVNKGLFGLFVLYEMTIVGPLLVGVWKSIEDSTVDWLWHPTISLYTVFVYFYNFIF